MMQVAFLIFASFSISVNAFAVDFKDEEGPFVPIATEQFKSFLGRHQTKCEEFQHKCKRFAKCFCDCKEQLIRASDLDDAAESLTEEQRKESESVMTNPCVGMFAYCLSVDFFTLKRILRLETPDAF
ncbi:unnamed protein product [Cylicostephanus goldi]|uniref:Uncharacterized protein n=1 Tax=Cylicostephanus goldi TaxID=71465 RepID=A0A3P6U518_CYLGO|nr:unnamed protein product [Cylicostephanus goldi]